MVEKSCKCCPKLSFQSFGPFPIIWVIHDVSMELQLPPPWTLHTMFHVSWLKCFMGTNLLLVLDEEQAYFVDEAEILVSEQILLHKFKHVSGNLSR